MVNFLDVTFDLNSGVFKPFKKENDTPVYVNKQSNHPPAILKNIPLGVNNRLSRISSNETVFNMAAPEFQAALNKSRYNHKLVFEPKINTRAKKKCENKCWRRFFENIRECLPSYQPPQKTVH